MDNPSHTFTVFDAVDPQCYVTITVNAPPPCSQECDLEVDIEVSDCDDNDTPGNVSDDFYIITLNVTGTNDQPWMEKQKFDDGTEIVIYQGTEDEEIELTLLSQDGDFTLWVFLSDYFDCLIDTYIDAPETCSGCLDVVVNNKQCYDNGTSDPSDDYWTFDIEVDGGSGYWTAGSPINDSGSYNDPKTIWVGTIAGDITFTITDSGNPECRVEVTVSPPEPCSVECILEVTDLVTECKEVEGTLMYVVTLNVEVNDDQCFMVKRKNDDGSEEILGTYNGAQTLTYGPFSIGEEFTLWVMLCETFDCVRDFYIQAPEDCEDCIDFSISNFTCYDNGTSDPDDDYWTFDIIAFGPGSYWSAGYPINDSGSYGSSKTIWVGSIQDNTSVEFTIYDNEDERCFANVFVQAPEPCSIECNLEVESRVSDCEENEKDYVFYVYLNVQIGDDECFMVKKKNLDGSEEVLGTYNGSQQITLGPFPAGEDFTLWIMGCETFDCVRDLYINAPDCDKEGSRNFRDDFGLAESIELSPNPVLSILNVVSSSEADSSFEVYSMDGLVIAKGDLVKGVGRLNVTDIKEGIYFISIPQADGKQLVKRFIILK